MKNTEFLEELKLQFERLIHSKERLDNKANNMIAMTGTITTLFMGFGIFLLQNVSFSDDPILLSIAAFVLIIEIIFTFLTIRYSLKSYKLREYTHPVSTKVFYKDDELNEENVQLFKDKESDKINEFYVNEYLKCIKSYEIENELKTHGIDSAEKTFLISIILVPIFSSLVIGAHFFNL